MDENMESIFPIAQNIIRAASNNDTVPLLRQLQNNVLLDAPKKIIGGHPPHHTGRPAAAEHSVGQAAPTGSKLPALLNKLRGKSGLIGHLFDQFLVIIFPAQTVRDSLIPPNSRRLEKAARRISSCGALLFDRFDGSFQSGRERAVK